MVAYFIVGIYIGQNSFRFDPLKNKFRKDIG